MAKKVELNYQINIHEGVNDVEKSVQQIDQSLKNLKFFAYQIMFYNYYDRIKNGNTYIDFKGITDKIWICHTSPDKLYETPVNCVIKWSLYEQYAWHVYDITVNNVIKIK